LWSCFAAQVRQGSPQILVWIDRRVVDADLIVQVRPCRAAAMADVADHLAANYCLTGDDSEARHMAVDGLNPMAMVDHNLAAVAAGHLSFLHDAVSGRPNRDAVRSGDIDAAGELALAVTQNRVYALTEAAGDRPHDRPEGGNIRCSVCDPDARSEEIVRVARSTEARRRPHHHSAHRGVAQRVKGIDGLVIAL